MTLRGLCKVSNQGVMTLKWLQNALGKFRQIPKPKNRKNDGFHVGCAAVNLPQFYRFLALRPSSKDLGLTSHAAFRSPFLLAPKKECFGAIFKRKEWIWAKQQTPVKNHHFVKKIYFNSQGARLGIATACFVNISIPMGRNMSLNKPKPIGWLIKCQCVQTCRRGVLRLGFKSEWWRRGGNADLYRWQWERASPWDNSFHRFSAQDHPLLFSK